MVSGIHPTNAFLKTYPQPLSLLFQQPDLLRLFLKYVLPIADIQALSLTCKALTTIYFDQRLVREFAIVEPNAENCRTTFLALQLHQNILHGIYQYTELGTDSVDVGCLKIEDGRLMTECANNTCKIWDLKSLRCLLSLNGHTSRIQCIEIHQGKIYTGSSDGTCGIWDLKTGECLTIFKAHQDLLIDIKIVDEQWITGSWDKTCKVWDLHAPKHKPYTFTPFPEHVTCLDVSEDTLVAYSYPYVSLNTCTQHCCQAWNINSKERLFSFQGTGKVSAVTILKEEFITAGGENNGVCQVRDLKSGRVKQEFDPKIAAINCMKVIGSLAILGGSNQWKSWNYQTGAIIEAELQENHIISSMEIGHGFIFTGSQWHDTILIWDLKTGKYLNRCIPDDKKEFAFDGIQCLAFKNGKLISASNESPVRIWSFNPSFQNSYQTD